MGEIAEMMLDGTLCAGCGELLGDPTDSEPAGYPIYCSACGDDYDEPDDERADQALVKCQECGKKCKGERGYLDHYRAKHS